VRERPVDCGFVSAAVADTPRLGRKLYSIILRAPWDEANALLRPLVGRRDLNLQPDHYEREDKGRDR